MSLMQPHFVLGSSSPQRRRLLAQIYIKPDKIVSPEIDETPQPKEHPRKYVARMVREKLLAIQPDYKSSVILTGDTIVACGQRIFQKSATIEKAREVIQFFSGRRCQVISAIALYNPQKPEKIFTRFSISIVAVKRLTPQEIETFLKSEEWVGVVGFRIDGLASSFVRFLRGSHSGIIGLPLFETKNLLESAGIRPQL